MPPTSVHRFVAWTRLGNKSREQLHRPSPQDDTVPPLPEDGREKENNAVTADPLPSRDSLDRHSANVGQTNTPRSDGEGKDMDAPKEGAIIAEPMPSKTPVHSVGPGNEAAAGALDACLDLPNASSGVSAPAKQGPRGPPQLKHSKSFFTTFALAKKLRLRKRDPVPLDCTPDEPTQTPGSPRQGAHRPQAVPISLSNDIVSKERREEALRSLGLLPPRDLSAMEADQDRRIDALRKNSTSPPPSDNSHSDANAIAQSWRNRNSMWLSQSPPNSDTDDPMTEASSSTDASSHSGRLSELMTAGADASDSVPLISSPSITKFLTLASHDSATRSLKAASSRRSQDSGSSRPNSPILTGLEGLVLPSYCFEDLSTDIPIIGASEDVKMETASAQSAPPSPVLSKTSSSSHSQDPPKPQTSSPSVLSKCSLSPSRQQEDSQTPISPLQLTSEPPVESSPKILPAEPQPEPLEVAAKEKPSVPDLSPLLLFPNVSDTFLASPTTPTLSPSWCYSPSEVSDITPTVDNGDPTASRITDIMTIKGRRADITPFADKKSEGAIIQEVIVEEPFPDEDDLDPFASPSSPSLPTTVVTPPASKSKTRATRASTLGPSTSAGFAKPSSLVGLRRQFTNSLFRRPRASTTVSYLAPTDSSPPPSPLDVRVHNRSTIYEEASRIDDDEVRRLSELAFMT